METTSSKPDQTTGKQPSHAITIRSEEGRLSQIKTDCIIEEPESGLLEMGMAVWDTGANITAISTRLAENIKARYIDSIEVRNTRESCTIPVAIVKVHLPVGKRYKLRVVVDDLLDDDILIGMDIISHLDFHITHDPDGTPVCIISEI